MQASYRIRLKHFEGPFELLLHFIERDELDIYDIPIAQLTNDFLDYIKELEQLNIDVASDFVLMAATLMKIKSRMLIPRRALDEDGNEIDPRADLVQKLLEYKRFKDVLGEFQQMETIQSEKHPRGHVQKELAQIASKALVDLELESLSLYKLLQAYHRQLKKLSDRKNKVVHEIVRWSYTVRQESLALSKKLSTQDKVTFSEVFEGSENRVHAIIRFLAMLELINAQKVSIIQGGGLNNFWLQTNEPTIVD